jgi:hypothetical protein
LESLAFPATTVYVIKLKLGAAINTNIEKPASQGYHSKFQFEKARFWNTWSRDPAPHTNSHAIKLAVCNHLSLVFAYLYSVANYLFDLFLIHVMISVAVGGIDQ